MATTLLIPDPHDRSSSFPSYVYTSPSQSVPDMSQTYPISRTQSAAGYATNGNGHNGYGLETAQSMPQNMYRAQDDRTFSQHMQINQPLRSVAVSEESLSPFNQPPQYPSHSSSSASPPVQSPPTQTATVTVNPSDTAGPGHATVPSQAGPKLSLNEELALRKGGPGSDGFNEFMRPLLDAYIAAPNRIQFGERTIIVMSSKVAQKSYGSEKRFLCPPPMAVFIGNSWWSQPANGSLSQSNGKEGSGPKLLPPQVVVSISGEPNPTDLALEWSAVNGHPFDPSVDVPNPELTTFVGRAVGKHLYISEADEKRKKVEALVHVAAPQLDDQERLIGIFKSRPIKVISKPSKKRQSAKNLELCINHGSTVALFHRLRAQTVSTKYLCVAGSGAAYKGSDGQPLHNTAPITGSPSFAARTTSWDSFIIYIVDTKRPSSGPNIVSPPPPVSDYPSPPPNVIQFLQNGAQVPIYYNQTVVLQCLTSGVVSPTLVIRRVDHSTTVLGGGQEPGAKSVSNDYCPPGEVCGDPVSQLHKIAFEVFDPSKHEPTAGTVGQTSMFLACLGEKVNTHQPDDTRSWNAPPPALHPQNSPGASQSPSLPGSPITASTPTSAAGEHSDHDPPPSSDGGRVRRARRSSRDGSASRAPNSAKNRRRQNSTGSNRGGSGNESGGGRDSSSSYASGALWAIDVGETSIWTIVGTEQIRYNFYVPPQLYESSRSTPEPAPTPRLPQLFKQPIPWRQVTPFPDVVKFLPPDRAAEAPKQHLAHASAQHPFREAQSRMLTLYGTNFSRDDPTFVFFGSEPSPMVEVRCSEVLACLPPPSQITQRRPMLLVRGDGVVYPSSCLYP
ncbi:hypothetical protein BKA62DRAFT_24948 [Auriculariales sp. MPI-PUGE-AT-0066]|nr:hypothetical protein BKA62DRAFT_24948 [Auriculariales sp. MPI-PUGE-AT-0066]